MTGKISVCMATYNGQDFLADQISSILPQLGRSDELIISDDGSSDSTREIILSQRDFRIKLIQNPNSRGIISNFENALKAAKGDFIFLADQDDIWSNRKAAVMTRTLQSHALAVCDCTWIDHAGKTILDSFFRFRRAGNGVLHNLFRNSFVGCCMAFRKDLLRRCLPFPPGIPMHDWWIGLVAETQEKACFLNEVLVNHRRHGNSMTLVGRTPLQMITDRLTLAFHLYGRFVGRIQRSEPNT